ncbi:MAG: aspartate carbamoyltransferase regulatory subunit [Thermoplasmata archaeon]
MEEKVLKVTPIKNGTVIDHIPSGNALKIIKILGIEDHGHESSISILIHVPSKVLGWKDVIKIEDRELKDKEVNKITLIAPNATINIIRNERVFEKKKPSLPKDLVGIVKCVNPNCISNKKEEKVEHRIIVESQKPLKIRCYYCDRVIPNPLEAILV